MANGKGKQTGIPLEKQFQFFGVDVMIDSNLKPWLIELNSNPYLYSKGPNVRAMKKNVLTEIFNLLRLQLPANMPSSLQEDIKKSFHMNGSLVYQPDMNKPLLKPIDISKRADVLVSPDSKVPEILDYLTAEDVKHLLKGEDEKAIAMLAEKIYPTNETSKYLKYFDLEARYEEYLTNVWERKYGDCSEEGVRFLTEWMLNNEILS